MQVSKLKEEVKRVAYCGGMDPKDYSVTLSLFKGVPNEAFQNYDKTFAAVADDTCGAAVVPFENSMSGEVGHVVDLMFEGDLNVVQVVSAKNGDETTRYAVLSKEEADAGEDSMRFVMMFTVNDEPGALAGAINVISEYGFNMKVLRSRPLKDLPWHYYFYVEAEGDDTSENGRKMLADLKDKCQTLKVLGRFSAE